MNDVIHISSFVIFTTPDCPTDVAKLVAAMPGAEVARHENGKLVVVFETERDDTPLIQLDSIALLEGVALISPIYHRIEPRTSFEFTCAGARTS